MSSSGADLPRQLASGLALLATIGLLPGCWALSYDTTTCDLASWSLEGEVSVGGQS